MLPLCDKTILKTPVSPTSVLLLPPLNAVKGFSSSVAQPNEKIKLSGPFLEDFFPFLVTWFLRQRISRWGAFACFAHHTSLQGKRRPWHLQKFRCDRCPAPGKPRGSRMKLQTILQQTACGPLGGDVPWPPRRGLGKMLTLRSQDKLQALLLETEQHPMGSVARTQSLEKIRSMLLDR